MSRFPFVAQPYLQETIVSANSTMRYCPPYTAVLLQFPLPVFVQQGCGAFFKYAESQLLQLLNHLPDNGIQIVHNVHVFCASIGYVFAHLVSHLCHGFAEGIQGVALLHGHLLQIVMTHHAVAQLVHSLIVGVVLCKQVLFQRLHIRANHTGQRFGIDSCLEDIALQPVYDVTVVGKRHKAAANVCGSIATITLLLNLLAAVARHVEHPHVVHIHTFVLCHVLDVAGNLIWPVRCIVDLVFHDDCYAPIIGGKNRFSPRSKTRSYLQNREDSNRSFLSIAPDSTRLGQKRRQ